ncbi:MAG: hypothetical protein MJ168_07195 [Clostridia bacterium]|nr:hypothetical protein [Clostridia bacterium]
MDYGIPDRTLYNAKIHFVEPQAGKTSEVTFTPAKSIINTYSIRVDDRTSMLQFIELDKGNGTGARTATVRILDAYGWKDVGKLEYSIK